MQMLAHGPTLDAEPIAELVDGGTGLVAHDEFPDLLGIELRCCARYAPFGCPMERLREVW